MYDAVGRLTLIFSTGVVGCGVEKTERERGGGVRGWVLAELSCVKVEVAVLGSPHPQ